MKNRWLGIGLMLALIVGISTFLHLKPKTTAEGAAVHEISTLKMAGFTQVKVDFPTNAPVGFEKVDGQWKMTAPYQSRADQMSVQQILSIIAAKTKVKLPATDLSKFGLDKPTMRLKLSDADGEHVFSFGTYNPVTEEQYVGYEDNAYLLPVRYSEAAATQPIEMVDKHPLFLTERKSINGFDLSRLEQFASIRLQVDLDNAGQWKTNATKAKPTQNELNEWLEYSWVQAQATSVEFYTPEHQPNLISFDVKLKNGKKITFVKMQESPEYLLARPDEGIIYHFPNDVGFTMLNPPLNLQ
jgi:hypothetical protein